VDFGLFLGGRAGDLFLPCADGGFVSWGSFRPTHDDEAVMNGAPGVRGLGEGRERSRFARCPP
jgi:hypothetical protein